MKFKNLKSGAEAKQEKKTGGGPQPRLSTAESTILEFLAKRKCPRIDGVPGGITSSIYFIKCIFFIT